MENGYQWLVCSLFIQLLFFSFIKVFISFQTWDGLVCFQGFKETKKTPQRWVSRLRKFKQLNKAFLKELPITDRFNSSSNLTRVIVYLSCWELNISNHQTLHTLLAGEAWHLWFSSRALGRDQSLHKHQLTFAWGKPWFLKCFIWNLLCHRNPERHFLSIHTLVLLLQFPFVSFRFSPKECTGNLFRTENQRLLPRRTQSVVKGAPLAISFRTSSSSPLRAASSNLFPRSTKDIFIHGNKYLPKAALKARKRKQTDKKQWGRDILKVLYNYSPSEHTIFPYRTRPNTINKQA